MNLPFYSTVCQQKVSGLDTLTHPVTRERYGGTDWQDAAKLAEVGAIPLTYDAGELPENPVLTGTLIVVADDGLSAREVAQWRSKTADELAAEYSAALATAKADVNTARDQRLEALTVTLDGLTFDADNDGRTNLNGVLTAISLGIPVGTTILWRDSANVNQALTPTQLVTLGGMMLAAVQQVYEKSWEIKDNLLPTLSTEELLGFNAAMAFDEQ